MIRGNTVIIGILLMSLVLSMISMWGIIIADFELEEWYEKLLSICGGILLTVLGVVLIYVGWGLL